MRSITLFFGVALLALAVWASSSPGFALTVPISTKTRPALAEGLTGVSKKVIQIGWRRRTAVSSEQRRKAAKAWVNKAKRFSADEYSDSRTSEATRRARDQLFVIDALRSAR